MHNENDVRRAVDMLKNFAIQRDLGTPSKILFMDELHISGVGAEWPGEIRNAIAFKSATHSADAKEAQRRLNEWLAP